jgi:leucyl aminopeptidase
MTQEIEDFTPEGEMWIAMDSGVATLLTDSKIVSRPNEEIKEGNTTLLPVDASMLTKISQFIHKNNGGCGAFRTHRSLEEGQQYLERRKLGDRSVFVTPTIDNSKVSIGLELSINPRKMGEFNRRIVRKFKNRHAYTESGIQAAEWIKEEWNQIVSSRNDIDVTSFEHSGYRQNSIIVTIPGMSQIDDIIILGAHLDSVNSFDTPEIPMKAPGADDNGSGLAVLTETLRVIVKEGYRPKKSIKIMGFANEEIGLIGSADIASKYRHDGKNVLGMVNFDMVGYKGIGKDIYISADRSNLDLAHFLRKLLSTYLPRVTHEFMRCKRNCSDHASWHYEDFPSVMATEGLPDDTPDTFNPNYHSSKDTEVNEYHMSNYARLAVIYLAEHAKGTLDFISGPDSEHIRHNGISNTGLKNEGIRIN